MSLKIEIDIKDVNRKLKTFTEDVRKNLPTVTLRGLARSEKKLKQEFSKHLQNIKVSSQVRTEDPKVTTTVQTAVTDHVLLESIQRKNLNNVKKEIDLKDVANTGVIAMNKGTQAGANPKGTAKPHSQTRFTSILVPHDTAVNALTALNQVSDTLAKGTIFYDSVEQKYYYLTGKDADALSKYIKIRCSTETGVEQTGSNTGNVHEKTKDRFERELRSNSEKGRSTDGGNFATFTIKNEGLQLILDGVIGQDITPLVHAVQNGDMELARSLATKQGVNEEAQPIQNLMENGTSISQNPYSTLKGFIDGLHWEIGKRKESKDSVRTKYHLVSSSGRTLKDIESALDSFNSGNKELAKVQQQTSQAIQNMNSALMIASNTYVPDVAVKRITTYLQRAAKRKF